MTINRLTIHHLRNITEADVQFSPGINYISGKNGSGKSSLLEAIYMLGRGRSFRTTRFGPVVQHGERSLTLFANTHTDREHRIGIQKSGSQTEIKVDGQRINQVSTIAKMTPLQILTPLSHEILERGPEYRRRFIEWGVFHVEHAYYETYKKFYKALRQRNHLLRSKPSTVGSWNRIVGSSGESLNSLREIYFKHLNEQFQKELGFLQIGASIAMTWKRGWDDGISLVEALQQKESSDIRQGFTQNGPQRADIKLAYDGRSAFTSISRGQQKMIISALHLAQAAITEHLTGIYPILLLDDLVSELDDANRRILMNRIAGLGCQAFITATDAPLSATNEDTHHIKIDGGRIL
ncbi:DNA replication/repair protein RecF [Sedimenticola sp.]|uniref:DNA replication/repair protein RecF n=1 Tax=Sedimenticola sp. TaxID=1940285 RepID=UPI003D0A2B1B